MQRITIDEANAAIAKMQGWTGVYTSVAVFGIRPGGVLDERVPNYAGDDTAAFGLLRLLPANGHEYVIHDGVGAGLRPPGTSHVMVRLKGSAEHSWLSPRFSIAAATAYLRAHGRDCEVQDVT